MVDPSPTSVLAARASSLIQHGDTCLERLASGITAFSLQDPARNGTTDDKTLLGVRIDWMLKGSFLDPYYLFFSSDKRNGESNMRIIHHTIPSIVPLTNLARRHLFSPSPDGLRKARGSHGIPKNLVSFVRAVRHELISYHRRIEGFDSLLSTRRAAVGPSVDASVDLEYRTYKIYQHGVSPLSLRIDDDGDIAAASRPSQNSPARLIRRRLDTSVLDSISDKSNLAVNSQR